MVYYNVPSWLCGLQINNKYVIKSGTDFRQFSKISITFGGEAARVAVAEVAVTADIAEDQALKDKTDHYSCTVCLQGQLNP